MTYDYKHVFKLSDFCDAAKDVYNNFLEIKNSIESFLTKKIDNYYAGNPFISLFVYGSKFENSSLNYDSLFVKYTPEIKLLPNYNLEINPNTLILKDFTLPLFTYLNNIFISNDVVTANVVWWYSHDVDRSKIINDAVLSNNITSGMFYKNTSESFQRIYITDEKAILPTKKYMLDNFNQIGTDIVECGVSKIEGNSFSFINGGNATFLNPIVLYTSYVSTASKKLMADLLNYDNVDAFIRRDLSNVTSLYIDEIAFNETVDNMVLSKKTINKANKNLKDKNDYTVDSSYVVENNYSGQDVLTAKKAVSLIKTHIEEYYIQIVNDIVNGRPSTDIGKLIEFYKNKISTIEENYILLKNHALSSFYNREDYCLEKTSPLTFLKQTKCADSNVSIEISNKVLTKGVFKRWLIQCINDRIPL